tara:strand:+ start:274 stop:630 length:357 start_codon:yes stop_codon:yes gene_type:complete
MKHFEQHEFDSPDLEGSGALMDCDFLEKLQRAREITDIPFKINSGYRTIEHNSTLENSKPNSSHLKGLAVDISCTDSRSRFFIVTSLLEAGFTRIGVGSSFIHVDADLEKSPNVIWTY